MNTATPIPAVSRNTGSVRYEERLTIVSRGAIGRRECMVRHRARQIEPTEPSIQKFNDELLASTVWSAITQNEETSGAYVEASAKQGRVLLTGTARSKKILQAITELAETIDGVEELVNEMNIGTIWRS